MGGYDVAQLTPKIGLGNIKIGGTPGDVGIASAIYNAIKAGGIGAEKLGIKETDPYNQYGDIGFFGSIAKNYQGAKGLSESDRTLYEDIISGKTQSDIDRFRSGLYAANQVDKATGDRLYGGNIENLFEQYKKSPSTFFYAGDDTQNMYDRFNKYYADGGRVGLFMGGDPLTGQALAIYNSMNSYGFSDQEIANALEGQGYYTPGGTTTPDAPTTIQPIGFQSNNEGGGGITELTPLNTKKNISSGINRNDKTFIDPLNEKIANQMITQNPNLNKYTTEEIVSMNPDIFDIKTDKGFIGNTIDNFKTMSGNLIDKFSGSKVGEGITEGATKFKNFAITPMMALMQKRNPLNPGASNYNPNLQPQMDFLEGITGTKITGTSGNLKFTDNQMMIGTDPNSGLAKYGPGSVLSGQNVVSGFGTNDYEKQLEKYIDKMISRRTKGVLSEFQQKKLDAAYAELKAEQERQAAAAELAAAASRAESRRQYDPNIHGPNNYGLGSDGKQSFDSGQGFGINATTGGPVSNKTGKGRTDYSKGGLATMFKEKR